MVSVRVLTIRKALCHMMSRLPTPSLPPTLTLWLTFDLQAEDCRRSDEAAGGHGGGGPAVREQTKRRGHRPRRHRCHARPAEAASGERETQEMFILQNVQTVNTNAQTHKLNIAHEQELIRPKKKQSNQICHHLILFLPHSSLPTSLKSSNLRGRAYLIIQSKPKMHFHPLLASS